MVSPELQVFGPISEFLWHVAPACVGALIGASVAAALTGWILQRHFTTLKNEADFIDFLIEELGDLYKTCIQYWHLDLSDGTPAEKKKKQFEASQLEASLKAMVDTIISDLKTFSKKYKCPEFEGHCAKLHSACTGGDFEVKNRHDDRTRCAMIVALISQIRSALLHKKL